MGGDGSASAEAPGHCGPCRTVCSRSVPESGGPFIDQVYVLQSYAEGWKEGTWEEKIDARPCLDPPLYSQDKHEYYRCGGRPGPRQLPSMDPAAAGLPKAPSTPYPCTEASRPTYTCRNSGHFLDA